MTPKPAEGTLRLIRGCVVGAFAVLVSLVAHSAGGGPSPGLSTWILLICVASFVGLATSGRQYRFARALTVVGAAQPLLHVIATASTSHPHHIDSAHAISQDGLSPFTVSQGGLTLGMVAMHAGAVVLAAVALAALDVVVWGWMREVCGHRLPAIVTGIGYFEAFAYITQPERLPSRKLLALGSPRRGPPWLSLRPHAA